MKSEKKGLNSWMQSHRMTLQGLAAWLLIGVLSLLAWWALTTMFGCVKTLNPPLEERVFFANEVRCRILAPSDTDTSKMSCQLYVPQVGDLDNFLLVGQGAYAKDHELMDKCIEKFQELKK